VIPDGLGLARGLYNGRVLIADTDRERAAVELREHFVQGRLTVEELSHRTGRVMAARSRSELRSALADLPVLFDGRELAARGRSMAHAAIRGAALVVFTCAYILFSFALLLVLGLTLLIHGASAAELIGFLVVWLLPTYLLARLWRRGAARTGTQVSAPRA